MEYTELAKGIALYVHLNERDKWFIYNSGDTDRELAFVGYDSEDEAFDAYDHSGEQNEKSFLQWCYDNLEEIEPYDESDYNRDYDVFTDSEANKAWDAELDNYLEECIYPELPDNMRNYFDDEKWKIDARMDGRGHSLSRYDGNESEVNIDGEWFYIYRQN